MHLPTIWLWTYWITWQQFTDVCLQAFDLWYRHIDTAQVYENEQWVWNALQAMSLDREEVFVTTKVWLDKFWYDKCQQSVEESLRKLQTEYIDLVLLHRPNTRADHHGTLDALMELQQQWKIKHIGVSNFTIALLQDAIEHTWWKIVTNQIEYHCLFDPVKIRTFCQEQGIQITAYAPLWHRDIFEYDELEEIWNKYWKSAAQVALRRLIEQEWVSIIPKTKSVERLQENIDIFDFTLDDSDKELIGSLPKDRRHFNPVFHPLWDD